jgi:hypothetical protein
MIKRTKSLGLREIWLVFKTKQESLKDRKVKFPCLMTHNMNFFGFQDRSWTFLGFKLKKNR